MAEYHVGCGLFGIYAGILNKKGDKWHAKTEVTKEALESVAQFLLFNNKEFNFSFNENDYALVVEDRIKEGEKNE